MTDSERNDAERTAIECELQQLRFVQPFPTAEAVTAHNARLEELTKRLQALPKAPERATGMRWGAITIASGLGNIPPPDTGPAQDAQHHHSCTLDYGGAYPDDD